jgi:hypothetical protein
MENQLTFEQIFVKENFTKLYDIEYFDGILLSLFKNNLNQKYYIYDWCDTNMIHNRWIVSQVELKDLYKYLTNEISLLKLYHISSNYGAICDVDGKFNWKSESILVSNIASKYLPNSESMFDKNDCEDFDNLIEFVEENLNK